MMGEGDKIASVDAEEEKGFNDLAGNDKQKEKELSFICPECSEGFLYPWHVKRHYSSVHEKIESEDTFLWPCPKCERKFKYDWHVSKHFIEDHIQQPITKSHPENNKILYKNLNANKVNIELVNQIDWDVLQLCDVDVDQGLTVAQIVQNKTTPSIPDQSNVAHLKNAAPKLKQSKYFCEKCKLSVCTACFKKNCGAHSVQFKGTATFSCEAC